MAVDLPSEIIRQIACLLPQNDLLRFAYTCKDVYHTVHDQIYQTIVIGSNKQRHTLRNTTNCTAGQIERHNAASQPVIIRTLYNLTRFLETLVAHPDYARFILVLSTRDRFPDIPEYELHTYLSRVFPHLVNLQFLHWFSIQYPLQEELVQSLPCPAKLLDMRGNFCQISPKNSKRQFSKLLHIEFSNIGSAETLGGWSAGDFANLNSLTLSRTASSSVESFSSALSGCCRNSIDSNTDNLAKFWHSGKYPKYISKIFRSAPKCRLHLRTLSFKDIALTADDARLIQENIDVSFLNHLSLDNCFEIYDEEETFQNQVVLRRRTPPAATFIDVLFEKMKNLQSLKLGLFNNMNYNLRMYEVISKLSGLSNLSIHVKHFCSNRSVDLAPLVSSVLSHKDTLQYLRICSDVTEQFGAPSCSNKVNRYNLESIAAISGLKHLKVLSLPIAISQIKDLAQAISSMNKLRIVQLLVTDSATALIPNPCNGCNIPQAYTLCGSNSLIAQEYFDCAGSFAANIKEERNEQFRDFTSFYRSFLVSLAYLRFDLKSESLVFDCASEKSISLEDQAHIEDFDSLMQQQLL